VAPSEVTTRAAGPDDGALIALLIAEHAAEEKATILGWAEDYADGLAAGRFACVIAERAGEAMGLAKFYHTFSSWSGRRGLFLEDLYVRAAARGLGVGRLLLAELARIAAHDDADRIDLVVQEANPARAFYGRLGWREMPGWRLARADAALIATLANEHRVPVEQ
jgi:ribosomal protein S18 acetylase RimI-like enzyme